MAAYNGAFAVHETLTAATVDTVILTTPGPRVTVINRGTAEIYFNVGTNDVNGQGAATPTVGGADTYVVPSTNGASVSITAPQEAVTPPAGIQVKLISTGTPPYSVEIIN